MASPEAESLRPAARNSAWQQAGQWACVAALAFACYFLISNFFLQSVTVVGHSMAPTLANADKYLLNRWIYYVNDPAPEDVVVLEDPGDHGYSVKRVIATGGDSVYLSGGAVYVNGRKLEESYLAPGTQTFTSSPAKEQLFKCADDQYFVLGDNRMNSADSRVYGPVPRKNILGQIIR